MSATPRMGLTEIEAGMGANASVPHNEALRLLEAMACLAAIDLTNTPPGSPADGDVYVVGTSPSGAWSGHASSVAVYFGGWKYVAPKEGFDAWVTSLKKRYRYSGGAWARARLAVPTYATGSLPSVTAADAGELAWDTTTDSLKAVNNAGAWVAV